MKTRIRPRNPRQSSRNTRPRFPSRAGSAPKTPSTQLQIVSSMYAYLMTSWDELPDENKRALGFDFVVGSEGEEKALNHMARLFLDYADFSFRRALIARRRRLGIDEASRAVE